MGEAMPTRREFGALLGAGLFSTRALASVAPPASAADIVARTRVPALALVGQQLSKQSVIMLAGERAAGSGVSVTATDKWQLASVTKSMTATVVALLVDRQALEWDTTVGQLLGGAAPDMEQSYREATLRQLLNHRAGLRDNVSLLDYTRFRTFNPDPREERLDYARRALGQRPIGPAGSKFGYSNNGYIVAGVMMELATGKSWEELMREHLFLPLGMADAGFGPPGTAAILDQPRGHMQGLLGGTAGPLSPTAKNADNPAAMYPCGGVHASLADMTRFLAAHRDRTSLLSQSTWDVLHEAADQSEYAMGWFARPDGKLEHGGWNRRWISLARVNRRTGTIAFTATNTGDRQRGHPAVEQAIHLAGVAASNA
jgi:CubicO group peptidase (beta-lactamase class C family)